MHILKLPPLIKHFNKKYQFLLQNLTAFILFFAFLAESAGLPYIFIIVASTTMLMLFMKQLKKRSFTHPPKNTIKMLALFFLLAVIVISLFTQKVIQSLIILLELTSLVSIIFLPSHILEQAKQQFPKLLVSAGFILCIYSLFLVTFHLQLIIPTHGYQLVYSRFGSHNHLGDFLVLPMLTCLYFTQREKKKKYMLLGVFFLPFFLFSYSRSAYLSLIFPGLVFLISEIWNTKKNASILTLSITTIILASVISLFFFSTVFESRNSPLLSQVHQALVSQFGLRYKYFGANRLEYANTALKSAAEKPLTGVGPGNFIYASLKFTSKSHYGTNSSHNIFLDILAEDGIVALALFVSLVFITIQKSLKKPTLITLLFFALLVNFQTDYTFKINPMIALFFFCISIICLELPNKTDVKIVHESENIQDK